jgi:hypothetical protein
VLGANKSSSELIVTKLDLLVVFHSLVLKKQAGDSVASRTPSLSSSISIKSTIPSVSVSVQKLIAT